MKYIEISEFGGPENLKPATGPQPEPGPGQVLIRVVAAGVNRPDIIQRLGNYPPPPGASPIPGLEVAGEVTAVGEDVDSPTVGDQVCALVTGGGYAEYAVAEAALCLPVPSSLTVEEAAALPETFFTVWSNVFDRARLKQGETFLVHGGSSGIGTTAIQIAKAMGATVFSTAGSEEKCAACRELGADHIVNYKEQDFVAEFLSATGDKGIDVILDMVLGDYMQKNISLAAQDGRIVIIAGLQGFKTEVNFAPVMRKRLVITGSTLRPRDVEFKAAIARNLEKHVWPKLDSGGIKPVIHKTLPREQAAEAHRIMEASEHIGKILLLA
ncbi:MAG: NAD(P)H-quinone oxidoreductase [Gammaproteobacteria bacterium]